jgi:hypothetical protein
MPSGERDEVSEGSSDHRLASLGPQAMRSIEISTFRSTVDTVDTVSSMQLN